MRRLSIILFIALTFVVLNGQLKVALYRDLFFGDTDYSITEENPMNPGDVEAPNTDELIIQEDLLSLSTMIETRDLLRSGNLYIETTQYRTMFGNRLTRAGTTQGSGFVFYQNETTYYVLTNYHILVSEGLTPGNTSRIQSLLNDELTATIVAFDASLDLAVLSFTSENFQGHVFNLSDRLEVPPKDHEFILAVGNPLSVLHMVTYGIYMSHFTISSVDFQVIYHSAVLHPGSSGGALTDINGAVLGINTWSASGSDVDNFAIPLPIIIDFLERNDLAH